MFVGGLLTFASRLINMINTNSVERKHVLSMCFFGGFVLRQEGPQLIKTHFRPKHLYHTIPTTADLIGEDHGSLSYPFACRSMRWLRDRLADTRI